MKMAKNLLGLMALSAALFTVTAVTSAPAEAYSYQTNDYVVVGKRCRFGNSGCYNVYGYRWTWHFVPDTRVSATASAAVNRVSGSSAADSAGDSLRCSLNGWGCYISGISTQVKTPVPTLDNSSGNTVTMIRSTAPYVPQR